MRLPDDELGDAALTTAEQHLANRLATHPEVLGRLRLLARAAGRYMLARARAGGPRRGAGEGTAEPPLDEALSVSMRTAASHQVGQGRTDYFAGRIRPDDTEGLRIVFLQGLGNARDSLTQVYRFWAAVFLPDVFGSASRDDWQVIAAEAWGPSGLAACQAFARAVCKDTVCGTWQLSPAVVSECRWLPTFRLRRETREQLDGAAGLCGTALLSDLSAAEFVAGGGQLDGRCDEETSPHKRGALPWICAAKTLTLEENHPWVATARAQRVPLLGAISHSAAKYRLIADQLGATSWPQEPTPSRQELQRRSWLDALCFIAYLVPIRSHTIHEVLSALSLVDPLLSAYRPQHAIEISNMPADDLVRHCPLPLPTQ